MRSLESKARALAVAVVLSAAGCLAAEVGPMSPPGTSKTAATADSLPCEVAAVARAKCWACHQDPPRGGAHFPLLRYADFTAPFGSSTKHRWQRIAEVIAPEGRPHMPKKPAPDLTEEERATLEGWFAEGALGVPVEMGCDPSPSP